MDEVRGIADLQKEMPVAKQDKRSPVEGKLFRLPGESLRSRLADLNKEGFALPVGYIGGMWSVLILMWVGNFAQPPKMLVIVTVAAAVMTLYIVDRMRRMWLHAGSVTLGENGEVAVGQMLERLKARGYEVFHDIGSNGFNIDHVVVGPGGVFVLETKTRNLPPNIGGIIVFDGQKITVNGIEQDKNPIQQVRTEAQWVRTMIREACGIDGTPRCIVVYPGWYTDTDPASDVWVLNNTRTIGWIKREGARVQSRDAHKIAAALRKHAKR